MNPWVASRLGSQNATPSKDGTRRSRPQKTNPPPVRGRVSLFVGDGQTSLTALP
jgi:hypothetical protein